MRGLEIPQSEVLRRFADDNPWWVAGNGIDPERQAWPRRAYFAPFADLVGNLEIVRAVVLIGPRRVGKTVMIHHAIQGLLDRGVVGTRILYLSLDTPLYSGRSLESLVRAFVEQHSHKNDKPLWIFFDEIQYLKDWEVHLKSLVDTFRWIRFVASGSAAVALKRKSQESGAGRFTDFLLPPLTFAEYLKFIGREEEFLIPGSGTFLDFHLPNIDALNQEFVNYLNYGGFPEAVMNPAIREQPRRFLKEDIVEKVLLKDLPSLYGIANSQELNRFFNVLAYNSGSEVSPDNLSKATGINKQRLLDYLDYLEAAFLIRRLHRIDNNAKRLQRATTFKVYLTNPSLRAALFGVIDENDPAFGLLVETAVLSQWLHHENSANLHYARWKQGRADREIDFVMLDGGRQTPSFAVEVKSSDRAALEFENNASNISSFIQLPSILITSKTASGANVSLNGVFITIPYSVYCYSVGAGALDFTRNLLSEQTTS